MPAVFVHGVPDTHRVWMPVVDRLSRGDVVALDLPGFGSGVPDGFAVTKDAYVDWLIEAIARIGEPVDLVGHDWGCALTARVASLRPDLVRSWAGGGGPVDATYEWHPLAKVFQAPGRGEAYFARFDAQAFAGRMEQDGVPRAHADDTAARIDATMQACILRLYRSAVTMGAEWQPGLAAFRAPALVLWGARDPSCPVAFADRLAEAVRARRVLKLDAGHWFPVQHPDLIAAALRDHWRSAAAGPRPVNDLST